jgi:septum formation inhibitor-activating ATPase MinD
VRKVDNLHVPIVLKSGSFNLLESSGPVRAGNGIALAFRLILCDSKEGQEHSVAVASLSTDRGAVVWNPE